MQVLNNMDTNYNDKLSSHDDFIEKSETVGRCETLFFVY